MKKFVCFLLCCIVTACAGMANPIATPVSQPLSSVTPEMSAPTSTEFSVACDSHDQERFISPNGNWLVVNCLRKIDSTLEIVNSDDTKHWLLQLRDYVSIAHDEGAGPGDLKPEYWSSNGEFLYFTSTLYASSGYVCYYPDDREAQGLFRLNLSDGTVSTILPPVTTYNDITFAPTGRWFAYGSDGDLIIFDLQTSNELKFSNNGALLGNLIWSADNLELVYATCESSAYDAGILEKSTVKVFSIQKKESKTVLEMKKNLLHIESWDANNILAIRIRDKGYNSSERLFDMNTNQWIIPLPKP